MAEVTCLGILVADVVGKPVDQTPERGKLTLVDTMELHIGGSVTSPSIQEYTFEFQSCRTLSVSM